MNFSLHRLTQWLLSGNLLQSLPFKGITIISSSKNLTFHIDKSPTLVPTVSLDDAKASSVAGLGGGG